MIFIKKIVPATSERWGICTDCAKKSPISMLCQPCLDRRSAYFHRQFAEQTNSWEWRIRSWLMNWFDPTKSKRY